VLLQFSSPAVRGDNKDGDADATSRPGGQGHPRGEGDSGGEGDGPLFVYSAVTSASLPPPTPALLTQPFVDILPFPPYFHALYACLRAMKDKDRAVEAVRWTASLSRPDKVKLVKVVSREKVGVLEEFLLQHHGDLGNQTCTTVT
jgi:hypothetical protein